MLLSAQIVADNSTLFLVCRYFFFGFIFCGHWPIFIYRLVDAAYRVSMRSWRRNSILCRFLTDDPFGFCFSFLKFYFHTFCLFDTVYFILIVSLCLCVACVIIVLLFSSVVSHNHTVISIIIIPI